MRETFTVSIPPITDQEKRVVEQAEKYLRQVNKTKRGSFMQSGVKKIWVEFEFDDEKKTKKVMGVVGLAILPDVRVFHMADRKATVALASRILGVVCCCCWACCACATGCVSSWVKGISGCGEITPPSNSGTSPPKSCANADFSGFSSSRPKRRFCREFPIKILYLHPLRIIHPYCVVWGTGQEAHPLSPKPLKVRWG